MQAESSGSAATASEGRNTAARTKRQDKAWAGLNQARKVVATQSQRPMGRAQHRAHAAGYFLQGISGMHRIPDSLGLLLKESGPGFVFLPERTPAKEAPSPAPRRSYYTLSAASCSGASAWKGCCKCTSFRVTLAPCLCLTPAPSFPIAHISMEAVCVGGGGSRWSKWHPE